MDIYETEIIAKNEHKGCPVCKCKETEKWNTQGACGSTDSLYYCKKCGVVRMWL